MQADAMLLLLDRTTTATRMLSFFIRVIHQRSISLIKKNFQYFFKKILSTNWN